MAVIVDDPEELAAKLILNLIGRSGFKQLWDEVTHETRLEILDTWTNIIEGVFDG